MRFVVALALLFLSAQPSAALTCAEFDDLRRKADQGFGEFKSYLDGWLSAFAGASIGTQLLNKSSGIGNYACFPEDRDFTLDNQTMLSLYDDVMALPGWKNVDKSNPHQCLADSTMLLALKQRYPCR